MCKTRKVHYSRDEDAWKAAAYCIENLGFRDVKIYFCPHCRSLHLTTAKVQLHDYWWRPEWQWSFRVKNWFQERGQIQEWDS